VDPTAVVACDYRRRYVGDVRSQTEELAAELKQVIRLATRDPEALEGTLAVLSSFHRVLVLGEISETARVHFILHRLIAEYAARLPAGRDGRAIRELLTWEDADGDARSLTTRYHHAAAHLVNAPGDFGRRQEPRLLLECARRFIAFDHDDRLDVGEAPAATAAPPPALANEPGLSPLAPLLWTKAEQDHQRRLAAIRGGIFSVSNQEEVLDLLLTLTRAAEQTLHAVDQTGLERWFGNARLQYYLEAQLQRARADKICVERLRFIRRGQLDDPRERSLLREFIRLHDQAGATLLLCPAEAAHELRTSFDSRMFMALIDIDPCPVRSFCSRVVLANQAGEQVGGRAVGASDRDGPGPLRHPAWHPSTPGGLLSSWRPSCGSRCARATRARWTSSRAGSRAACRRALRPVRRSSIDPARSRVRRAARRSVACTGRGRAPPSSARNDSGNDSR
jgi:hypothetical protein